MNGFLGTWAQQRDIEARKRVLAANKGIELELGKDNNDNPAMMAKADFLQTWERLATVLVALGFEIDDKDQTLGIYFVSYSGAETESFLDSIKFWKSSENNKLPLKKAKYQLNLSALSETTAITMFTKEGTVISIDTLSKIYPDFAEQFGNRVKAKF
jgi:outer membrane protein assembly factor BamC